MDESSIDHIKGVIEALLFVSEKPVTLDQIKEVLESVGNAQIKETLIALQNEYTERDSGMGIVEIAGGYQMLSSPHHALSIRKFFKTRHKEKLSKPALETLAIIAYKQPVTRTDIELIRGVNSDGVSDHLLNKGLVKIVGRKDVPGKPYLYGTTKQFLEYFGLKSLNDLPKLEDFASLQTADDENTEHQPAAVVAENEIVSEEKVVLETQIDQPQAEVLIEATDQGETILSEENSFSDAEPSEPLQEIPSAASSVETVLAEEKLIVVGEEPLQEERVSSEIINREVEKFLAEAQEFQNPETIAEEISSMTNSEATELPAETIQDEPEKEQATASQSTAAPQETNP